MIWNKWIRLTYKYNKRNRLGSFYGKQNTTCFLVFFLKFIWLKDGTKNTIFYVEHNILMVFFLALLQFQFIVVTDVSVELLTFSVIAVTLPTKIVGFILNSKKQTANLLISGYTVAFPLPVISFRGKELCMEQFYLN